jgi:hypothetical protein
MITMIYVSKNKLNILYTYKQTSNCKSCLFSCMCVSNKQKDRSVWPLAFRVVAPTRDKEHWNSRRVKRHLLYLTSRSPVPVSRSPVPQDLDFEFVSCDSRSSSSVLDPEAGGIEEEQEQPCGRRRPDSARAGARLPPAGSQPERGGLRHRGRLGRRALGVAPTLGRCIRRRTEGGGREHVT